MIDNCGQVPIIRKTTGRGCFQRELEDLSPCWGNIRNVDTVLMETACIDIKGSSNNSFITGQCYDTAMDDILSKYMAT